MSLQRRDSLNDLLREWDKVISKPQTSVPRIRVRDPSKNASATPVKQAATVASSFLPPSTSEDVQTILAAESVASVPPVPEVVTKPVMKEAPVSPVVVPQVAEEEEEEPVEGWERLEAIARRRRVDLISATFAEYLVFLYLDKSGVLAKGFGMEKLQEGHPGNVSRVFLGIDQIRESVWWRRGTVAKEVFWRDLVRIEYSWTSNCFVKIQKRFREGSIQRDIPPWNCFSLITNTRSFDFYDLPECASSVSREVVAVETGKLSIVSRQIENFLFALSYLIRASESVSPNSPRRKQLGNGAPIAGLFKNMQQLRLERGKMKLGYVFREAAGKREFLRAMRKQAEQEAK